MPTDDCVFRCRLFIGFKRSRFVICDWWISILFVCFCVSRFVSCDRNYDWQQRKTQLWRRLLTFRVRMFVKSAVRSFCSSDFFFLFWVDVIRGDEDELFELRESWWSKSSERQWNLFFNSFLLNKWLYGPRSNRLPFLHTIFLEKGTLFVYLRLTNGTPCKYLV